jgi:MFS transporter, PPP family, 3-phenylpropionic acid transporter
LRWRRAIAKTLRVTDAARLSLFYAAFFFATGVQLPFWPVWLAGRGLGPAEIGALLALSQWVRVAANPVLGFIADRARERNRFMVLLGAATFGGYLLCLPAHGFAALVVPSLIVAAAATALLPLADATTLAAAARGGLEYGRVRLWGTIAFIAATLIGGRILAGRSSEMVLVLLLGMTALTTASCAALPRAAPIGPRPRANYRGLIAPRHLVFVAAATLIQSSHAVYYAFGTLYWQHEGFGDGTIAVLWAEGAVAEVALFFAGGRYVRRWGPGVLLALGGAGGLVRWTVTAWTGSLPVLLLVQPLHALTFAAVHLGAMHYLAGAVPPAQAATAQALFTAIVGGVGLGLASLLAGALYGAWGGGAYLAMAAMAGAGGALALRIKRPAA